MTVARAALAGALILALFVAPLAAQGQRAPVYRVRVVLHGGPYSSAIDGLRDGLRELGFEEGQQFVLDVRDTKGDLKSVEAAARSREAKKADLIYDMENLNDKARDTPARSLPEEHDGAPGVSGPPLLQGGARDGLGRDRSDPGERAGAGARRARLGHG
jgi:hypothetical protein